MEPLDIYALIQPLLKKEIDNAINAYANKSQFNVVDIPLHSHTGVESPQIAFENLGGIPVFTSLPVDSPENGTMRILSSGGTKKLIIYISGTWYSTAALT